ncbi:hypothetical protein LPJ64_004337 [Coemansia asiatica]|uniref:Uncharacterized protein n=1 Tax=Coemansia asiatica TaxID=1052880 RepID=A0A9W7XJB6_9FUNG|nr:hypothetical protein LPJ64_004337 [Coemansia asiatica]
MDENDAPTVVLNSIRAARRQELRFSRAKPTPLATRVQTPVRGASSFANASLSQQRQSFGTRGLRNINEDSEDFDDDEDDGIDDEYQLVQGNVALKTPMGRRIEIFRDTPGNTGGRSDSASRSSRPEPLFGNRGNHAASGSLGRQFEVARDVPLSAPVGNSGTGSAHLSMASSSRYGPALGAIGSGSFATPGRSSGLDHQFSSSSSRPASVLKSASASSVARFGQTPGYTRTATGYSISGAEFSALSGFTGMSTIGGPSMLANEHLVSDGGEDDHYTGNSEISHTPMRKRLSMAAKDLCKITPRFPKQMVDGSSGGGGGGGDRQYNEDEDDEYEDADDGDGDDEPCTENIGEFADLDSQMNELQMQLGTQFARHSETPAASSGSSQKSKENSVRNTPKRGVPLFEIFRD